MLDVPANYNVVPAVTVFEPSPLIFTLLSDIFLFLSLFDTSEPLFQLFVLFYRLHTIEAAVSAY